MKTAIDAVNEKIMNAVSKLEGELLNAVYANTHKSNYKKSDVFLHKVLTNMCDPTPVGGFVIYSSDQTYRDDVEFICTTEEFLATVAECETNFGECDPISVSHYKLADKVLLTKDLGEELAMDIDWSKAPEGAIEYAKYKNDGFLFGYRFWLCKDGFFIEHEKRVSMTLYGGTSIDCDGDVATNHKKKDFVVLSKRLVNLPTYTQEMYDNGVSPSVGMMVMFKHGGYDTQGTVTAITKEFIVLTDKWGKERIRMLSESPIKPLTPPKTDKEKAIDEYIESQHHGLDSLSQSIKTIMKNAFEAGVSFQPLTVEVK